MAFVGTLICSSSSCPSSSSVTFFFYRIFFWRGFGATIPDAWGYNDCILWFSYKFLCFLAKLTQFLDMLHYHWSFFLLTKSERCTLLENLWKSQNKCSPSNINYSFQINLCAHINGVHPKLSSKQGRPPRESKKGPYAVVDERCEETTQFHAF